MAAVEYRHRAMASDIQVIVVDVGPDLARDAVRRLDHLEQRWSRFLPGSDITRLNRHPGIPIPVDPDTLALIAAMIDGWRLTHGRYDPTLLPALAAAGYAASIDNPGATTLLPADTTGGAAGLLDITVDRTAGTVTLPPGLTLDPGGIGKGLAADLVVGQLLDHGAAGALVSIGGDLAMAGQAPHPGGWFVTVEDPLAPPNELATLAVTAGGVCTSSTQSRRWRHHDHTRHHLIDPTTGGQADTDLAAVTVIAGAGWLAEAHATAALLAGSSHAISYLDGNGLSGIITTTGGVTTPTSDLRPPAPTMTDQATA
jgi:FAD:protein FMN transferase